MKFIISQIVAIAEALVACLAEFGVQHKLTGFSAAADLSAKQYIIVRASGTNQCNQASHSAAVAAAGWPIGVLQNKPKSGEAADICFLGMTKVQAGSSVTANGPITTNSSGRAVDAVSGDTIIGRALEASATEGLEITALIFPPQRWAL
jgi:hypothetical protein